MSWPSHQRGTRTHLRLRRARAREYVSVHRALGGQEPAARGRGGGSQSLSVQQRAHVKALEVRGVGPGAGFLRQGAV